MKKKTRVPRLITVEVITLITVALWIVFEVYRLASIKPGPTVPDEILTPLNSSIDLKALNKVDNRIFLEDNK